MFSQFRSFGLVPIIIIIVIIFIVIIIISSCVFVLFCYFRFLVLYWVLGFKFSQFCTTFR